MESQPDGVIVLTLILIAGIVYWWISRWMRGDAKAISGHTIDIGENRPRVRLHALYSLQPPYKDSAGQPWTDASGMTHDGGAIAKGMLAQRIAGRKVKVRRRQDEPSFGRDVGQVFVGCEDVGLSMVKDGWAFAAKPRPYIDEAIRRRYERAEKKAKRKGLGFHAGRYEDPLEWIKPKIQKNYARYGENAEELARRDEGRFRELAETIAKEIGEEMFVEWAIEFALMV